MIPINQWGEGNWIYVGPSLGQGQADNGKNGPTCNPLDEVILARNVVKTLVTNNITQFSYKDRNDIKIVTDITKEEKYSRSEPFNKFF